MRNLFQKLLYYWTVVRRAKRNERNYRRWLAAHTPEHGRKVDATLVYTDKAGNNFYVLNDPGAVSMDRVQLMEERLRAAQYKMTTADLVERFTKIETAVEANDAERVMKIAADCKYRLTELAEEKTLLDLACTFFLIDGESPYALNHLTFARKKELAANDDALRAFFLQTAWEAFFASVNSAKLDIVKYLAGQAQA